MKLDLKKMRANFNEAVNRGLRNTPENKQFSTMLEALEEAREIIDDLAAHGDGDIAVSQEWLNKYFGEE